MLSIYLALFAPALLIAAQTLPRNAPACATSCFTIKVAHADSLAPSAKTIDDNQSFVQAYYNCLYDNCDQSTLTAAIEMLPVVCADQGVSVLTSGITGAATAVETMSLLTASASESTASASQSLGGYVSPISPSAVRSLASSASSANAASATSGASQASQGMSSVLSSASQGASSSSSSVAGLISSLRSEASSVLSAASSGVVTASGAARSAAASATTSGAGVLVPATSLGVAGLLVIFLA